MAGHKYTDTDFLKVLSTYTEQYLGNESLRTEFCKNSKQESSALKKTYNQFKTDYQIDIQLYIKQIYLINHILLI